MAQTKKTKRMANRVKPVARGKSNTSVKPVAKGKRGIKTINLALQGGGTHGAFTWGVIDRLLEDPRIAIDGIVGTSAGAFNGAVAAYGLAVGGPDGAREALHKFWKRVAEGSALTGLTPTWTESMMTQGNMDLSPTYLWYEMLTRSMSPYQLNPLNLNPLRELLEESVDFEVLRKSHVRLFSCASNVLTGRIRVFECHEASVDTVLASACLPTLFQSVEIDGQHYWDGGYMGNPPLFPLIYSCDSHDVLLVMINPISINEVPKTAQAIIDRVNTLSFNSNLVREMRAIHFVTRLIDDGYDHGGRMKRMLIHTIDAEDDLRNLGVSSKYNASWDFLQRLFELGRAHTDTFLDQHFDKLGRESSTDIVHRFL